MPTFPLRTILIIAAAAILVCLVLWGPAACSRLVAEREARKVESGQADAMLDSIDIAKQTEAEREVLADQIEAENKALADSIRAAEPGDSNDAAMAAVCATRTYRDHPDCVALKEKPYAP